MSFKTFFMHDTELEELDIPDAISVEGIRLDSNFEAKRIDRIEDELESVVNDMAREKNQLQTIFDAMPQCVYVSDLWNHNIYYANPSVISIHGSIGASPCYKLFHNREEPCLFCNNAELINGGGSIKWDLYNEKLGRHFQIIDQIIDWPGVGKARLEIATDVTELKQQSRRNQALLEAMPDMMFVLAEDGTYIDFHAENGNRKQLTISPGIIVGSKLSDANFPPNSVAYIMEKIQECLACKRMVIFEYDVDTPVGHHYYEARMVPFVEGQVLATVRNISNRIKREIELHKRQVEVDILAEVAECGVIFHRDDHVFFVSDAFTKMTGFTKDDLNKADSLTEFLFHPDSVDLVMDHVNSNSVKPYRASLRTKGGEPVDVIVKPSYHKYNGNPEPVRVAVMLRSIPSIND